MSETEPTYKECQEYSSESVYDYSIPKPKNIGYEWVYYILLTIIVMFMYYVLNWFFIPSQMKL